jgi:hypothetical protein
LTLRREDRLVEPPISHRDVTTTMGMIGDIQIDVRAIRQLMEDEDDGEKEDRQADG